MLRGLPLPITFVGVYCVGTKPGGVLSLFGSEVEGNDNQHQDFPPMSNPEDPNRKGYP